MMDPVPALDRLLRGHPRFTDFDAAFGSYNFRLGGHAPSMPHVEARIEAYGVYFCDYADDGSILAALRALLEAHGTVTLARIE